MRDLLYQSHLFLHPYNEAKWDDQVLHEPLALRTARAVVHAERTLIAGFTTERGPALYTSVTAAPPPHSVSNADASQNSSDSSGSDQSGSGSGGALAATGTGPLLAVGGVLLVLAGLSVRRRTG